MDCAQENPKPVTQGRRDRMNKIRQMLWNVISSGLPSSGDIEVLRKVVLQNLMFLLGGPCLFLFIFVAYAKEDILLAAVDLTVVAFLIALFFYLRKTSNYRRTGALGTTAVGLLFTFQIAHGGMGQTVLIWSLIYPLIALFLLGNKRGGQMSLLLLGLAIAIFILGKEVSWLTVYQTDLIVRFIAVYIIIFFFSFTMEKVRYNVHGQMETSNLELQKALAKVQEGTSALAESNRELRVEITDRRRAEESLRESEELLRNYLDNAPDGIYMSDLEGNFLYGNRKCEEITGYGREELIGKNFLELNLLSENSLNIAVQLLQVNKEGRATGPDEIDLISKEGRLIPIEINTNVVQRKGQRIVIASVRDITERKQASMELQISLEKLRKAMGWIIQAMSRTIETRDPYTSGHQRRVADLSRSIAHEMGLPEDQVDGLRMAGIVHDLGKIAVPAEILSKPTKLSNIELALIKVHPQTSYDILKDIDFPWPVAEIVFQHHERMDGSGYPRGLKGDEIFLEARILMVADVVEAMASHRPYRPALGIDKALEEISQNKGILYDPEVVEVCLRLFRNKGYRFN
jgi:PAS domain S-box-containing protein